MQIGILTFHNAINYGAIIQCYALMKLLEQRGHDVEIVDYRVSKIEEYRNTNLFNVFWKTKGIIPKIKHIISAVFLEKRKKKVIAAFDNFLTSRLKLSKRYDSGHDISNNYDYIIFGSDQIWNPKLTNGFDPVFWGQMEKRNAVFATYAASMGEVDVLTDNQWKIVEENLRAFDFISVRELALKECLKNKFDINVTCCIDPTFLTDFQNLDSIAIKPQEDNYVYLYNVTKDKHADAFADRVSSLLGCKIIKTDPKPRVRLSTNNSLAEAISPEEFLGYIKYARLVIGNSFHAIALSIVFKKDFYSLDSYRPERIKGVLKTLNLIERHVSSTTILLNINSVDYSKVEGKIKQMKEHSLKYINEIGL